MAKGEEIPKSRRAKLGFHGTDYDFTGFVLPKKAVGHHHFDMSGEDDTYFLPADGSPDSQKLNEAGAWNWSSMEYANNQGNARPRVHLTRPIGKQHMDRNLYPSVPESNEVLKQNAAVAPAQEILDTRWAPPATPGTTHVSQTLPHINWNQFNAPNWTTHIAPTNNGWPAKTLDQKSPMDVSFEVRTRSWYPGPEAEAPAPAPTPPQRPSQSKGRQGSFGF